MEKDEFYLENGLLVFTERYHLRRGRCCGSACRHCPYQHAAVPPDKKGKPYPYFPPDPPRGEAT